MHKSLLVAFTSYQISQAWCALHEQNDVCPNIVKLHSAKPYSDFWRLFSSVFWVEGVGSFLVQLADVKKTKYTKNEADMYLIFSEKYFFNDRYVQCINGYQIMTEFSFGTKVFVFLSLTPYTWQRRHLLIFLNE